MDIAEFYGLCLGTERNEQGIAAYYFWVAARYLVSFENYFDCYFAILKIACLESNLDSIAASFAQNNLGLNT